MSAPRAAAIAGAALAIAAAGCTGEPREIIVHGDAIDHGAALFRDPAAGAPDNVLACATCHEAEPSGGPLLLPGAPLAGATRRTSFWGGTERELHRAIEHCRYYFMFAPAPWGPESVEARAMYAFLESIEGDDDPAPDVPFTVVGPIEDPPPGDPARGAAVYDRACKSCHGAAHTGVGRLSARVPVLPEQTLAEHPIGTYTPLERRLVFVEKVRHGGFFGYGGQMPPFSLETISEPAMQDLIAFLGLY